MACREKTFRSLSESGRSRNRRLSKRLHIGWGVFGASGGCRRERGACALPNREGEGSRCGAAYFHLLPLRKLPASSAVSRREECLRDGPHSSLIGGEACR